MKRNRLLIPLIVALLAAFIAPVRAAAKPNIIVILVDDIGVGDFGFTGGKDFIPSSFCLQSFCHPTKLKTAPI